MTVIAWDGKTLAADSLCSSEGHFVGLTKKLFRLSSGALLGTAGDEDIRELITLLQNVKDEADIPTRKELELTRTEFHGILILPVNRQAYEILIVKDEEDLYYPYTAEVSKVSGKHSAVGHGMDYALAAMDLGQDAQGGVRAAIKRSLYCRGPVQTMTINPEDVKKNKKATIKAPRKKSIPLDHSEEISPADESSH